MRSGISALPKRRWPPLAASTWLVIAPTSALAQAPPTPAPSLMPVVLALAAVLALIPVAVWLLKRFGASTSAPVNGLQVVSQLPLGTGQRVVVLQAGDRWLLLGVTAGSITRLGSLPKPPAGAAAIDVAPIAPPSFASLLARIGGSDRRAS